MQLRKITLLALALLAALGMQAQHSIDNPMTRAVLKVYEQQLQADPTDWDTWMRRANEYYTHSEYLRALNDVDNALKYIPEGKKADREQAYMLRANIYLQTNRPADALADLNSALALDPDSYIATYLRANAFYELERYGEAKVDYKRLQRLNPRSVESLIGQARIAVKENNLGMANELLDQAVSYDPNNADYYVRRSSVRRSMGNHQGAVEDLLLALSTDSNNARATQALVDYGKTNYPAVMAGLSDVIRQAPRVAMFVYLRARIAQAHYNYVAAVADYTKIIDENLYNYHGIYAQLAECQFALGRYDDALFNINHAIDMDRNTASQFVLKSQILRALNCNAEALECATKASVIKDSGVLPIVEMGLCYAADKNYQEAANLFGEATMTAPDDPATFMLRAWMLGTHLNQPVAAQGFYNHVIDMEGFTATDVKSLRGFALLFNGRVDEATAWMENILTTVTDSDGLVNYMGACFFCAKGDNDRALACAEASLKAGYANYYDWTDNRDGRINVAPLRDDLRFLNLLHRHAPIFGK